MYQFPSALVALGLTTLVVPFAVQAQVREVVSKEVSVAESEASLRLEFADDGRLEINFEGGSVLVDGEVVGVFEPGGELDDAWRELLRLAEALDDGPLAEALAAWTVPARLAGQSADVAQAIDRALEEALSAVEIPTDAARESVAVGDESSLIQALLGSVSRLGLLEEEALEGLSADFRVHIDEDRERIRAEARSETRSAPRGEGFRSVTLGVSGALKNLLAVLVLGLIGAAVIAFAGDNIDAISETVRRAPGRSAMVGFAGTFLLIPVWLLGFLALTVSIIGIPVAIAWLPLFPMAACMAALLGYLAVAQNAGEWLADSEHPWTGWIRKSNPVVAMFGGLMGLMFLFIVGNVTRIVPFLGFFTGLIVFAASLLTFFAVQIGFGAVLLTRAGRRPEYWARYDPDEAWEAAMNVDVEDDPVAPEGPGAETEHGGAPEGGEEGDA